MNILIIQILRMGDALQLIPVIKGIRQQYQDADITMLTSGLEAHVLKDTEEIDAIHVMEKESICESILKNKKEDLLSALDQLESDLSPLLDKKWDWIINLSNTSSSALLCFLFDAEHISGFHNDSDRTILTKENWLKYSLASFVNRRYSNFNWVNINSNTIGIRSVPPPPHLRANISDLHSSTGLLKGKGFDSRPIIGLQPGASGSHKMWPAERFIALAQSLVNTLRYNILIFGGKEEAELGSYIESQVGEGCLSLAGKTTIPELKAYLCLCDLLISNDTGPMHLAAALGTPVIALFFSTHFVETGPYGEGHVVIHPDIDCFPCQGTAQCTNKRCLEYISPETVEEIIRHKMGVSADLDPMSPETHDTVKTWYSYFDPWNFLDWAPLHKRPLTFQDLERLAIKLTLLRHAGTITGNTDCEDLYIGMYLSNFISDPDTLDTNQFSLGISLFESFREQCKKACFTAFDIQSKLMGKKVRPEDVEQIGQDLSQLEEEISSVNHESSLGFMIELLEVFRENIEHTDHLSLSTKTIEVYRNIMDITDGVIRRLEKLQEVTGC